MKPPQMSGGVKERTWQWPNVTCSLLKRLAYSHIETNIKKNIDLVYNDQNLPILAELT